MLTALVVWFGIAFVLVVPVARLLHRAAHVAVPDEPSVPRHTAGDERTSPGQEAWADLPFPRAG